MISAVSRQERFAVLFQLTVIGIVITKRVVSGPRGVIHPMPHQTDQLIDYAEVRSQIKMIDVLTWLQYQPEHVHGAHLRGRCPFPECTSQSHRTFCVSLTKQAFHCFHCGRHGNHLDLWAELTDESLYTAAIHLCQQAGIPVPDLKHKTTSPRNHPTGPH